MESGLIGMRARARVQRGRRVAIGQGRVAWPRARVSVGSSQADGDIEIESAGGVWPRAS